MKKPIGFWTSVAILTAGVAGMVWAAAGWNRPGTAQHPALLTGTPAWLPVIAREGLMPPVPTATPLPVTPPANLSDWRALLAYYRAAARLPALATGDAAWNDEARRYACQMAQSNQVSRTAPADAACGAASTAVGLASLLQGNGNPAATDREAIETWLTWPFHALAVLDPELSATAFGSFRATTDNRYDPVDMAAVLDVRRGRGSVPPEVTFPVVWPSHNTTIYLTQYAGGAYPDPRSSCPGYNVPLGSATGLPLLVQLGTGNLITADTLAPIVRASTLFEDGVAREHCTFTERDYVSVDPEEQASGRASLGERDAIVVVPRSPLLPGRTYRVWISTSIGMDVTWSFRVTAAP